MTSHKKSLPNWSARHVVGAARESVNKALTEFSQRGWIRLDGKSVLINDSEHLANRARTTEP